MLHDQDVLDGTALARLQRIGGAKLARQMIELYLQHGPERVQTLLAGAQAGDAALVERGAHTLKSSAGNVGAVRLQQIATQLEAAAAQGNIDQQLIQTLMLEYEASVAALRAALEEIGE